MARHALQRLSSPSLTTSLAIHALGLAIFGKCFRFIFTWEENPISKSYGGQFQYLTVLGLLSTSLCFALGLLADVTSSNTLFRLKNAASVLAIPSEVIVTLTYWCLYAVDPHLIVPDYVPLPIAVDLGMHLAPAVLLALDFLLLSPPWTISTSMALLLSTGLVSVYWVWVEICFSHNGWYPYPYFSLFSTPQRVLYFAFCGLFSAASTMLLKRIYACVNGREASHKLEKTQ